MAIDTVVYDADLPSSFKDDGYVLTPELDALYLKNYDNYVLPMVLAPVQETFVRNAAIFDVTGVRTAVGDIWSPWIKKQFQGIFYIVSGPKMNSSQFASAKRQLGSVTDVHRLASYRKKVKVSSELYAIELIKDMAIARIVDGQIQTSEELMRRNYYGE